MAIDAKQAMLSQIENGCADIVTARDMPRILKVINDVLEGFSVTQTVREEWTAGEDDLMNSFVASLKISGRSDKTIARYTYVIGRFMAFAKVRTRSVNVYHIRLWLAAEKERGIQDSTLEGSRQVLSSYFGWLHREGLIERNPMGNVGTIKVPKKLKKTYSGVDLEKLNQACECIRDRAILHFLRATGCRISEMTELNRDAVDLERLECVVHGKGNKERKVYLDDVAGEILREYLISRDDHEEALFIGRRMERLKPGGVRIMLNKLGAAAGVEHVHPHKFRRTKATELTRHGMQIQEVAALLGHDKLDTTMRYVVLNNDDIKSSYRRYA